MSSKRIAVLLHEDYDDIASSKYLMRFLIEAWREIGYTVELLNGVKRFVPADVIIPHLDLTVLPDEYVAFMDQYPIVVNRRIVDVSKSKISQNKVVKGDSYAGPVIVKTERNFGGCPERASIKASRWSNSLPHRILRKVARKLWGEPQTRWDRVDWLESANYPVFASLAEVPLGVFGNPHLMVEKFLPEIVGDEYCLRYFSFFGNIERARLVKSKCKIVKSSNTDLREEVAVPPELSEMRRRMGFDFGRFDYVMHDGKPVVFDANRTPTVGNIDRGMIQARKICEGISSILEASSMRRDVVHQVVGTGGAGLRRD